MSAATTQSAAQVVPTDLNRISEIPGAALPVEACRWEPDQAPLNLHLLMLLGEVCGRLEPSGWGGYRDRGTRDGWLTLAQVDPEALEDCVRRIRRKYPDWMFDTGSAVSILDKLDVHFAKAQARRRRDA